MGASLCAHRRGQKRPKVSPSYPPQPPGVGPPGRGGRWSAL